MNRPREEAVLSVAELLVVRNRFRLEIDSLTIGKGQVHAVIGPNGAGKTTLVRTICGLIRPQQGTIRICGKEPALARHHVSCMFGRPNLLMHKSLLKNVELPLKASKVARSSRQRKAMEALELTGADHVAHRYPWQVSAGEARKAALARALVTRPELLLLDEPFANLDASSRTKMLSTVRETASKLGCGVLFVSHDIHDVLIISDTISALYMGKLLQTGTPMQVAHSPANAELAALLGFENAIPARIETVGRDLLIANASGIELQVANPTDEQFSPSELVWLMFPPEAVMITLQRPRQISAKNCIEGTIEQIAPIGEQIKLAISGVVKFNAIITRASANQMNLGVGNRIFALIKANAIRVYPNMASRDANERSYYERTDHT